MDVEMTSQPPGWPGSMRLSAYRAAALSRPIRVTIPDARGNQGSPLRQFRSVGLTGPHLAHGLSSHGKVLSGFPIRGTIKKE